MPPTKQSQVVLETNRKTAMQEWYCEVLEGHIAYENAHLTFVTYDDEHHRVAFVDFRPLTPRDRDADMAVPVSGAPGLHRVAFTFGSMGELLANYTRLAAQGIRPVRSVNHGRTASLYYADPDGNRIELLVDHLGTAGESRSRMQCPVFDPNSIGVEFDPDEEIRKLRSGVPLGELVVRDA